jgi:hypothetical protein
MTTQQALEQQNISGMLAMRNNDLGAGSALVRSYLSGQTMHSPPEPFHVRLHVSDLGPSLRHDLMCYLQYLFNGGVRYTESEESKPNL